MKKNDIILLVVGIILVVIGFFAYSNKTTTSSEVEAPSTEAGIQSITYKQYEYLLDQNKEFILFIGATGCSWCEKFTPVVTDVTEKYNLTVYYLDISKLSSNQYNSLVSSNDWLSSNEWGTPTTLILSKNNTRDVLSGYTEESELVNFFQTNGFINE